MSGSEPTPTLQEEFVVANRHGLHVRPANQVVALTRRHDGPVTVRCGDIEADAKDIFALLMLAAEPGDRVLFTVAGPGADTLLHDLRALFARSFEPASR